MKEITPETPSGVVVATRFWRTPELLVIPDPLRLSVFPGLAVLVNPAAPELKTISLTVVFADRETLDVLETLNVAMSAGPSGTVRGIQLAAVFQWSLRCLSGRYEL